MSKQIIHNSLPPGPTGDMDWLDAIMEEVPTNTYDRRIAKRHIRWWLAILEKRWRADEHKILAALDEEGRKQRYLELHGTEGPHGTL